jgi:hypothetical protein
MQCDPRCYDSTPLNVVAVTLAITLAVADLVVEPRDAIILSIRFLMRRLVIYDGQLI